MIICKRHGLLAFFTCLLAMMVSSVLPLQAQDEAGSKPFVGAYYYPWFTSPDLVEADIPDTLKGVLKTGRHGWTKNVLRSRLMPEQHPAEGFYNSFDADVISQHINWSQHGNISFWVSSWWGPGSPTDIVLKDHILVHPDAGGLKYAILYESMGRIPGVDRSMPFENLDYSRVLGDFIYLRDTYFDNPHYLKVDGRPVVYVYLGREYFRNRGHEVLERIRTEVPEIYIVSDDVFGPGYKGEWAEPFDAVTAYDVYGQSARKFGGTTAAIEALKGNYDQARSEANRVGTAFVPAISPGYNDRAVREGNPGRARTVTDLEGSIEGDYFRAMITGVGMKTLDPAAANMMVVTSFNEWFEDTQIEPTRGTAGETRTDNSDDGCFYTGGENYVDYGTLYLEILADLTKASDE